MVEAAQEHKPVYVHFPLLAGNGDLATIDWNHIESFLEQTGTQYVNVHIAPNANNIEDLDQNTQDPIWNERIIDMVVEDIRHVSDHIGKERVIIENAPWDPNPQYAVARPAILPDVIQQIVYESGCGFLLDTAHVLIAALHIGMEPLAYLECLPSDKIKELHITGTRFDDNKQVWEDHFLMRPDDWQLAEHAITHIKLGNWTKPSIVALEYGGVGPLFDWRSKSNVIEQDLSNLYGLLF